MMLFVKIKMKKKTHQNGLLLPMTAWLVTSENILPGKEILVLLQSFHTVILPASRFVLIDGLFLQRVQKGSCRKSSVRLIVNWISDQITGGLDLRLFQHRNHLNIQMTIQLSLGKIRPNRQVLEKTGRKPFSPRWPQLG